MKNIWNCFEKIVYTVLKHICDLFHKEMTESKFMGMMEFIKFGIVGLSNTIVSYVLYTVALLLFQNGNLFHGIDYIVAQVFSFLVSVLWSFYWNNKMVFVQENQNRSLLKTLIKTYISYSFTGLFLNSFLLVIWVNVFGISEFVAPIISLLINVPLNFVINKFWAFKSEK